MFKISSCLSVMPVVGVLLFDVVVFVLVNNVLFEAVLFVARLLETMLSEASLLVAFMLSALAGLALLLVLKPAFEEVTAVSMLLLFRIVFFEPSLEPLLGALTRLPICGIDIGINAVGKFNA